MNITDLLAGGGTALVWKQEKSPFDDTESLTERIIIQATNVAVALLHVDNTVLAWAVDMATGAPVPDAQVALHSVEYNYQTSNVRLLAPIRSCCRRCLCVKCATSALLEQGCVHVSIASSALPRKRSLPASAT